MKLRAGGASFYRLLSNKSLRSSLSLRRRSCGNHWNTNLSYFLRKLDVEELSLPESVNEELHSFVSKNSVADASDYDNPNIFRSKVRVLNVFAANSAAVSHVAVAFCRRWTPRPRWASTSSRTRSSGPARRS